MSSFGQKNATVNKILISDSEKQKGEGTLGNVHCTLHPRSLLLPGHTARLRFPARCDQVTEF